MNILIIYRHFYPDSPPYASMLRSIGGRLVRDGHSVTVWCERPCYKPVDGLADHPARESIDGITVERLGRLPGWRAAKPIRTIDMLLFVPRILLKAFWARLSGRAYDMVWTASIPPVVQGWAGRTTARLFGARYLYHCQDLYPEMAVSTGLLKKESLLVGAMTSIERANRAAADPLVTLSNDMGDTVTKLATPRSLAIINNFLLDDFATEQAPVVSSQVADGKVRAIFAGNIGNFQDLDKLVAAMALLNADDDPSLTFMGEGKALPSLKEQAGDDPRIVFEGHKPFQDAQRLIAAFDFGIVTIQPNIYRFAYPSKTLTYFGLGLPVLAIVEKQSELARLIEDHKVGLVVPDRRPEAIAEAMHEMARSRSALGEMRTNVAALYRESLSREARLEQWSQLIDAMRPRDPE